MFIQGIQYSYRKSSEVGIFGSLKIQEIKFENRETENMVL